LFRPHSLRLGGRLANGRQIVVDARVSLYEPRGEFQLLVEDVGEAGAGALRRAYDALLQRLSQEGLFAAELKRPLPHFPRRIGIITSPTGAAVRDVISVLQRRCPSIPVLLYPVSVQGENAGLQIARAITLASERHDCDALLLVRGGGSLEDLWAFNEEVVTRAIRACTIPLVTGVGHEIDVTIADFAADLRASTPSAAAELVGPDGLEWCQRFRRLEERLTSALERRLHQGRQRLHRLEQGLARQHPGRRLHDRSQRLDELEQRLQRAMRLQLERWRHQVDHLTTRLQLQVPVTRIERLEERRRNLRQRLEIALRHRLDRQRQRLTTAVSMLQTVSPLQTLSRGYAIVRTWPAGAIVRRSDQAQAGDRVEALLAEGRLRCRVEAQE
jgi:exodeoxyribonuclease VII large subunit